MTGAHFWLVQRAEITKLTATSARIDVSFVELDGSGNPTGTPVTENIETSANNNPQIPNVMYYNEDFPL